MIRLNLRLKANKQLGRKREKGLIMTRERCTQKDKILVTIMTSQFRSGGFYLMKIYLVDGSWCAG